MAVIRIPSGSRRRVGCSGCGGAKCENGPARSGYIEAFPSFRISRIDTYLAFQHRLSKDAGVASRAGVSVRHSSPRISIDFTDASIAAGGVPKAGKKDKTSPKAWRPVENFEHILAAGSSIR